MPVPLGAALQEVKVIGLLSNWNQCRGILGGKGAAVCHLRHWHQVPGIGGVTSPLSSIQTHPRKEWNRAELCRVKKPFKVFLEDTLITNSVCLKNSIQTGFSCVGLIPTIKQFDPGFTNSGDQITVKKDIRNVRTCNHLSVIQFEILACSDSSVHQAFDLTHWEVSQEQT